MKRIVNARERHGMAIYWHMRRVVVDCTGKDVCIGNNVMYSDELIMYGFDGRSAAARILRAARAKLIQAKRDL